MSNKEELSGFLLEGIQVRTNNANGRAKADIGQLWQRFYGEGFPQKIANKLSEDLYCVYTDYESDHLGDYTCFLGYRVEKTDNKADTSMMHISAASYQTFDASGELPHSVLKVWETIWKDSSLKRAFSADFDLYKFSEATEGKEPEVTIYLSVK